MRLAVLLPYLAATGAVLAPCLAQAQAASGSTDAASLARQANTDAARDAARPIAAEGLDHYDAGRYLEATERFQKADALYPAPQYRVYNARAHAKLGRLVAAARAYASAAGMPPPKQATASFLEAQSTARAEAAELQKRIPAVELVVVGPAPADVRVAVDGVSVDAANRGRIEIDPGAHTLSVSAQGFETASRAVELAEGRALRVELALAKAAAVVALIPGSSGTAATEPDRALPEAGVAEGLSHHGQVGATLRGDIDPLNGGVLLAAGVSFGALDRLDVGAAALLGRDQGVEPSLTLFVLTGPWKPLIQAGVPLFFVDGVRAGMRGSAGIQWDPSPHVGIFAQLGGAYFGSVPAGYDSAVLLPSAGIQGRL